MRLANVQVEAITALILKRLKEKGLVVFKADEGKVSGRMISAITEDLRKEDELDREVEALLESHSRSLDAEGADYRKMFSMIKHKLARERDIIL